MEWEKIDWFTDALAEAETQAASSSRALAYPAPKPIPKPLPKPLPIPTRRVSHSHGPRVSAPLQVTTLAFRSQRSQHHQQSFHSVDQLERSTPLARPSTHESVRGSRVEHSCTPLPVPNVNQMGPDSLNPFLVVPSSVDSQLTSVSTQSVSQPTRVNPSKMEPPSRVSSMTSHSRVRHPSASQFIMDKWIQLLTLLGTASNVWQKIQDLNIRLSTWDVSLMPSPPTQSSNIPRRVSIFYRYAMTCV